MADETTKTITITEAVARFGPLRLGELHFRDPVAQMVAGIGVDCQCDVCSDDIDEDVPEAQTLTMTIRPLGDRIVVKRLEAKETSKGGIIIPGAAQEKATEATVIAVGEGRLLDSGQVREPRVKPGDRVVFAKYSGAEVTVDETQHLVLREDDILAVLE